MQQQLILVVDDDEAFREIIGKKLMGAGFLCETAASATEGHRKAAAQKPDLILLDINMPDTNGTQAILDFHTDPNTKDIGILLISNMDNPWPGVAADKHIFAKELGALGFIDKAADMDRLPQILAEHLSKK
jgi:CheY-like chemotaxis protein